MNDIFIGTRPSDGVPPTKIEVAPGTKLVDPTDAPRDPGGDAPGINGGGTGGECGQDCFSGPYAVAIDPETGASSPQY